MSFDIYIACFENGGKGEFPRSIVEKAFGPYIEKRESQCFRLNYDVFDRSAVLYLGKNEDPVSFFGVNRPTANLNFWLGIVEVLRQTNSVLFWAGGGCVVANASVIPHLAPNIVKTFGVPLVSTDVRTILDYMESD